MIATIARLLAGGLALGAAALAGAAAHPAHALTLTVDCSSWTDPPLLKTKLGVYQTPIHALPDILAAMPMLGELGVHEYRYELGWGKPDAAAHDQIGGDLTSPTIDFSAIDRILAGLNAEQVRPLLALTYCPNPLKTRREWPAWKDMPSDLEVWADVVQQYVAHVQSVAPGAMYEVWNEPDLEGGEGKVFFTGSPDDYGRLYQASAGAVRRASADAPVGGPALAWYHAYTDAMFRSAAPVDFVSMHAYGDPRGALNFTRGVVRDRPELPLLLTEYASYSDFGLDKPISRHPAAARFFADMQQLLRYPDCTTVYWAQWIDDPLGIVTASLHRKAIYNAMKLYQTMLPVDRCQVTADAADGVDAMAGADAHNVGVAVWNTTADSRSVTVRLTRMPFASGWLRVYRIDAEHASYVDNPESEPLAVCETVPLGRDHLSWTGALPGGGVVLLAACDGSGRSLLRPRRLGTYVRGLHWFPDRTRDAVADFDPHTWIARLSTGRRGEGAVLTGAVIANPVPRLRVQVHRMEPAAAETAAGTVGLRVDFASRAGGYSKAALFHGGPRGAIPDGDNWPWGTRRAADEVQYRREIETGATFNVNLARFAPADWDGRRIALGFILRDADTDARVRIMLDRAP